jgi:hypothetical protein
VSAAPTVADRLGAVFPGESIALVNRAPEMAARFDALANQRPATCGAYALSYLLPPLGFDRFGEYDLTAEDALAHLAGVVIEDYEVEPSAEVARKVASGELSEGDALKRFGNVWYRYPVRSSSDPAVSGTSSGGVARAIAVTTEGALGTIPIPGRGRDGGPQLTQERWAALFDLLHARLADWDLHAIFNYQSDHLLKPNSPEYTAQALRDESMIAGLPRDDWGVGHFAGLAGLWRRPSGERWIVLFDTYKDRGFGGYQPQPADLMREGLVRTDGRGGGMLLVLPAARLEEALSTIRALGIDPAPWANGSPEPEDWRWEPGR